MARRSSDTLTTPDLLAMAASGRGSGIFGYKVQFARNHVLIVFHHSGVTGSDPERAAMDEIITALWGKLADQTH